MEEVIVVTETTRLMIIPFTIEDAELVVQYFNDPLWITGIGDRKIRTVTDGEMYLRNGPLSMYEKYGFGPWKVILKENQQSIGMCGLIKRDYLDDPDLGFGFLSEYCGKGYGKEASEAIIKLARDKYKLNRLVAIVSPSNIRSLRLLASLGFYELESIELGGKETKVLRKELDN